MMTHPLSTLSDNQIQFLEILIEENVKFLIVGGYAMRCLGLLRPTVDFDILIAPGEGNLGALQCAVDRLPNNTANQIAHLMRQPEKKLAWYDVEAFSSMTNIPYDQVDFNALSCTWKNKTVRHISHYWMIKAKIIALTAPDRGDKRNIDEGDLRFLLSKENIETQQILNE